MVRTSNEKGWHNEPIRHSLASKGVETNRENLLERKMEEEIDKLHGEEQYFDYIMEERDYIDNYSITWEKDQYPYFHLTFNIKNVPFESNIKIVVDGDELKVGMLGRVPLLMEEEKMIEKIKEKFDGFDSLKIMNVKTYVHFGVTSEKVRVKYIDEILEELMMGLDEVMEDD